MNKQSTLDVPVAQYAADYIAARIAPKVASPFRDSWDFLTRGVWTRDEASGQVRQFPALDYIHYWTGEREKHRIFAIEKSRRMLVSWTFCAVYLYNILTNKHQADYIASRKLETSCELLGRLEFIYENIPVEVWPDKSAIIKHAGYSGKGYRRLECPATDSAVEAVAQGKDQLRQYTASHILLDEFAFWERAEESWSALQPTILGGGHIDLVSTPELGAFMYRLLYEEREYK
jgi:hypothetical protein